MDDAREIKRVIRETEQKLSDVEAELTRRRAIIKEIIELMPAPLNDVARLHYRDKLTEGQVANTLKRTPAATYNDFKRTRDMLIMGIACSTKQNPKKFLDTVRDLENDARSYQRELDELNEGFEKRFPAVDPDKGDATGDGAEGSAK